MYDYNYTMGERLYRPMMDSLDKRGPRGSSVAAEPTSTSTYVPARRRSVDEGEDIGEDGVSATIRRIRASRAAMEEETRAMEETSVSRRAATRARLDVSDRLMDSVGLTKSNGSNEFSVRKPRRAISEIEDDPFFKKRTFGNDSEDTQRWTKVGIRNGALNGSSTEDSFDHAAASARAKQSRARIAEIENEMDDLANRAKARGARRAAAGAALAEAADFDDYNSSSNVSSSVRSVKRTVVTEKRSVM